MRAVQRVGFDQTETPTESLEHSEAAIYIFKIRPFLLVC